MQTLVASPVQSSSPKAPKVAQLAQRKDGTVGALSSDGENIYTVRLDPLECTRLGFTHYGRCYHATQARERFGQPDPIGMKTIDPTARANTLCNYAATQPGGH